jgi:hypothetical protein
VAHAGQHQRRRPALRDPVQGRGSRNGNRAETAYSWRRAPKLAGSRRTGRAPAAAMKTGAEPGIQALQERSETRGSRPPAAQRRVRARPEDVLNLVLMQPGISRPDARRCHSDAWRRLSARTRNGRAALRVHRSHRQRFRHGQGAGASHVLPAGSRRQPRWLRCDVPAGTNTPMPACLFR